MTQQIPSAMLANGAATGAKLGSDVVVTSGDQTIGGAKTFSNNLVVNNVFVRVGAAVSGSGGNIRYNRDTGVEQWAAGILGSAGATSFEWYNSVAAATRMTLDTSGNLTAAANVTAYSDIRLKTDLTKISNALAKVNRLNGYTYTRIDSGERQTGVVAQEVQAVLPEAVIDGGEHLAVAYGNMVGLLIEAVKELTARVEKLEGR